MLTIYKYPLKMELEQTIRTFLDCKVLCVQIQENVPCLWVEVDDRKPMINKNIYIVGTGHPLPEKNIKYIGTVQTPPFVWHIYE